MSARQGHIRDHVGGIMGGGQVERKSPTEMSLEHIMDKVLGGVALLPNNFITLCTIGNF